MNLNDYAMQLATMNENAARGWRDVSRVNSVDPLWTREVSLYASMNNLDWCDARDIMEAQRGREYAMQETLDGMYPTTDTRNGNAY